MKKLFSFLAVVFLLSPLAFANGSSFGAGLRSRLEASCLTRFNATPYEGKSKNGRDICKCYADTHFSFAKKENSRENNIKYSAMLWALNFLNARSDDVRDRLNEADPMTSEFDADIEDQCYSKFK